MLNFTQTAKFVVQPEARLGLYDNRLRNNVRSTNPHNRPHSVMADNHLIVTRKDSWKHRRMVLGGLIGAVIAADLLLLDFVPVGLARLVMDFPGLPIFLLIVMLVILTWLLMAIVSLFQRRFRRATSSLLAVALVFAVAGTVLRLPIFNPWLWYVLINQSSLEEIAAKNRGMQNSNEFVVIEERDVSTGIAAVTAPTFVALVYDERASSDATRAGSVRQIHDQFSLRAEYVQHIYGKFYLRTETVE